MLRWLSEILFFSARPSFFCKNQLAWTTWIVAAKQDLGSGLRVLRVALGLGCLGR